MSTTIQGIGLNELKPSHDVQLSRSKEGLWTGSQSYSCRYVDHANDPVIAKLRKGTAITDLDSNIPIFYEFITLESHRVEHQRGGITRIRCTFKGSSENDGFGEGGTERSVSYSFRGVMGSAPIIEHPNYLAEVTDTAIREAIAGYYRGEAYLEKDGSTYYIRRKVDDDDYGTGGITPADSRKWIDKIAKGVRMYDRPEIEWSVTETNKGGMTQAELNYFGLKITTPTGDPPTPSWASGSNGWWQFSDLSETKDENSAVYTRTFRLRNEVCDTDIYDY